MGAREDIATAANTVAGVNVTPTYRQSTKTGDGFVRLAVWNRDTSGFGGIDTWDVFLAVPQDRAAAEVWLDDNRAALVAALNQVMTVTTVTPSELVLDSLTVNGVVITGAIPD